MDNQVPQVDPTQNQPQPQVGAQPIAPVQPAMPQAPVAIPAPQPPVEAAPQTQAPVEAPVATEFSPVPAEPPVEATPEASITWSAQEYIHPDKTPIWYILFGFVAIALVAVDIFFLRSWTFSALVLVMAIAVIVYIRRPARTLTYALSSTQGLYVGEQLHPFEEFKSFGLITADGSNSIMLVPRKRFAPGVSVYFPEEAGEQIVDILGSRLPMEELKLDAVDIIVRKLRL
ncbi:hypothetical protein KI440_00060 [Candidatus Saccharibacteria bacterium TM7i]|nr:hypothetical protein KI440_00060 [Candidatus Saccharibacteria bacterium TM7i]